MSGQAPNGNYYSTRQRLVVLTFDTAEDASAWDEAGCPLPVDYQTVSLAVVTPKRKRAKQ